MFLVFDIGGTNMRLAVSEDGQTLENVQSVSTPQDFQEGINQLKELVSKLANGQKIDGIAGGIAGPLDKEKTMAINAPNLKGWNNQPLKEILQREFNCPVFLENDAVIAGLGEASFGTGKGYKIAVYLTIGTGVGGAKIENGRLDENSLGFEPGHQIIVADGEICGCGGKGHLEAYASGTAIEKLYGQKAEDLTDETSWDQICQYLSIGLNNSIVHWSPEIIILGGSVTKSIPLDKVKSHLKEVLTIFPQIPEIKKASLEDMAGLYGALTLLKA